MSKQQKPALKKNWQAFVFYMYTGMYVYVRVCVFRLAF